MTTLFVSAPSMPNLDSDIICRKRADSIFVRAANLTMSLSLDPLKYRWGQDHTLESPSSSRSQGNAIDATIENTPSDHLYHQDRNCHKDMVATKHISKSHISDQHSSHINFDGIAGKQRTEQSYDGLNNGPSEIIAYRRLTLFGLESPSNSFDNQYNVHMTPTRYHPHLQTSYSNLTSPDKRYVGDYIKTASKRKKKR